MKKLFTYRFKNVKNEKATGLMLKLITTYSIFLFAILVLFFFLYNASFKNSKDSYNLQAQSGMTGRVERFEGDLKIMDTYCRQLLQENDFRRIMNQSEITDSFVTSGHELSDELAITLYSDSLLPVKEVFFYLKDSDYILSESCFIIGDHYYDWIKKYPSVLKGAWFELLKNHDECYKFLPLELYQSFYSSDNYYLYLFDMNDLTFLTCDVTSVFMVNRSELHNILGINESAPSFLTVKDVKNDISIFNYDTTDADLSSKISDMTFESGFEDFIENGLSLTIGKYTSPETGYEYFYSFDSYDSTASSGISEILLIVILVTVLFVGAFLIYLWSKRNVRPMIEMTEELDRTTEEKDKLQSLVDNQRPIIMRSYVRQIMVTSVSSSEEVDYIRNYLCIPENVCFKAMQVVIYSNSESLETMNQEGAEAHEFSQDIKSFVLDYLEKGLGSPLYYFISGNHAISFMLYCDDNVSKEYLLKVQNVILNLHNELLAKYNCWLFAGIGKTTRTLLNVWESYQQATEAISYTSKNYIFLPYEYIKKDSASFYYPQEFSNKLIHFVTTGNKSQALELLRLIRRENFEERSLSANLLNFLLSDIRNSLLKARFEMPTSVSKEKLDEVDEMLNGKVTFNTCESLTSLLCDCFAEKSSEGNLIDSIISYIKANYSDSMLCLSKIADEFKISETYFSHLFKQKTGENFSTYLENLRMKYAMELIKEGSNPLPEIYALVGYNNQNSFRRAFKKVYGTTPGSVK